MSSDLHALLEAIVADPSDDVARLVYADCLEEHGNAARAQFIRLQIEAGRRHQDSHARAELEQRAHELFAEHWIDWWDEVCVAAGMRRPVPKLNGRLGRLARWAGFGRKPGEPYTPGPGSCFGIGQCAVQPEEDSQGFSWAMFRHGFPDSVFLFHPTARGYEALLSGWLSRAPIASLTVRNALGDGWHGGPHLGGIRSLKVFGSSAEEVPMFLSSPHFLRVEELFLDPESTAESAEAFAGVLARALSLPRAKQLKRLHVWVHSQAVADVIAQAPAVAGLGALVIDALSPLTYDNQTTSRLATILQSPHITGLTELAVSGRVSVRAGQALTRDVTWPALRTLTIGAIYPDGCDDLDAVELAAMLETQLLGATNFPVLEELRISGLVCLDNGLLDALVRSPLLKQLKHFALAAWNFDRRSRVIQRRLLQMFDLNRIETFAFTPPQSRRWSDLSELQSQLGDRLRLPW
jgi:uncharacterized protein (TIGR02996 family)